MREDTQRTPATASVGAATFWVPARLKGLPAAFLIVGLSVIAMVGVLVYSGATPHYALSITQTGGLGVDAASTSRATVDAGMAAGTRLPAIPADSAFLRTDTHTSSEKSAVCAGDGTSGSRLAFYYVYFAGQQNRIERVRQNLVGVIDRASTIVSRSALSARTGGADESLRIVTDRHCAPLLRALELPAADADSLAATVRDAGPAAANRKYVLFADTAYYCGASTADSGDGTPSWARVDLGCWTGAVTARQIAHLLGASS